MNKGIRSGLVSILAASGLLLLTSLLDSRIGLLLQDSSVHVVLIALSTLVSASLGIAASRIFFIDGRVRSLSLAAAFFGFAAIYVWHGIFTTGGHPFAFLIYGPTSRLVFAASLLWFASPGIIRGASRFQALILVNAGALLLAGIGFLAHAPLNAWANTTDPANFTPIRLVVEGAALVTLAVALFRLIRSDPFPGRGTKLLYAGFGLLMMESVFFMATSAWTSTWWGAHALGAISTLFLLGAIYFDFQSSEQHEEAQRLRDLNQLKTNFINTAAHELGTPLTPIMLQLRLLEMKKDSLPTESRKSVELIAKNLHRLDGLIRRILDGSKSLAGKLELKTTEFELIEALNELHQTYQPLAEDQGIACSFEAPESILVSSDRIRIQQVVANAIDNALKFTPEGGSVMCKTRVRNDFAEVRIIDSGAGMPKELLEKLFQPFTQGSQQKARRGGSGLGLFLSREIMDALGGSMNAESKGEAKGSTLIIRIPLAKSPQ